MAVITVRKNNTYTASELFQWDTNRILTIYGLSLSFIPEIHFANSQMSEAIVKQATKTKTDALTVEIPNVLLRSANPIKVYICGYKGDEFISYYSFTIEVKGRPKPADYIAEDDEKIYSYNALENLVYNTLVDLKNENQSFRADLVNEVTEIINNTTIADAKTLDGRYVEEFELVGKPGTTVFNSDGSITTNYDDGSSEHIVFNADGSITTTRNTLELGVKTEITKFNSDGSITVEEVE